MLIKSVHITNIMTFIQQARPFNCEVCGKSYSRKSIRDTHMLTHGKEYAQYAGSLDDKLDL